MKLKDKVTIVTGGASGMGAATVRAFAAAGSIVTLVDLNEKDAFRVAGETGAAAVIGDVSDSDFCNRTIDDVMTTRGRVDILVNCAGIILRANANGTADEDWRRLLAVNVDAVFYMCRAFLPVMRYGGSIVNISSAAAHRGAKDHSAYAASKAAVLAFSRSLALEIAPGLRCNAISPGMIETEMLDVLPNDVLESLKQQSPFNRLGEPREIAEAIGFLCSQNSSFVTAETLHVNGAGYIAS